VAGDGGSDLVEWIAIRTVDGAAADRGGAGGELSLENLGAGMVAHGGAWGVSDLEGIEPREEAEASAEARGTLCKLRV
jgi:hypothetical protein